MEKLISSDLSVQYFTVDNKKITVVDNFLDTEEVEAFYEYVTNLSFTKREKDDDTDEFPIFSVDFICEDFINDTFIGQKVKKYLDKLNIYDSYTLFRAYINMSHYGDVEFPHYDCAITSDDITVLLYVNDKWDYRYGGETIFYENHDSKLAVLPKPGRLVIFPGNVEHLGSIPTRICKKSRFSLALKFTRRK